MLRPEEISEIRDFILEKHTIKHMPEMEAAQDEANAYFQRVGEVVNEAEHAYNIKFNQVMEGLRNRDEETESSKGAALKSLTADEKKFLEDMRLLKAGVRNVRMTLAQAIKTRREER